MQPHLYKYYYDYLIKISKIFKTLDEEISIHKVIEYIVKNDPNDLKYQLQYQWLQFSKHVKAENKDEVTNILKYI